MPWHGGSQGDACYDPWLPATELQPAPSTGQARHQRARKPTNTRPHPICQSLVWQSRLGRMEGEFEETAENNYMGSNVDYWPDMKAFSVCNLYNHIPNLFTHKLLIVSLWASMISPRLPTAGSTLVKNLPLEDSTGYSKEFKLLISHDPAHTEQPHLYLRYFFPLLLWTYQD